MISKLKHLSSFCQWIVYVMLLSHSFAIAQKNTNLDKAAHLKQLYKDTDMASSKYTSGYLFTNRNDNLTITNMEEIELISLKGNVNYIKKIAYNDHISISATEIQYANGKSFYSPKICGNYEVEDIFYSDAKLCAYKLNVLHEGTELKFKSKATYDDPKYLTKVLFHDELPIEEREIVFTMPLTVNVELIEKNFEGNDIKKTTSVSGNNKIFTYTVKNLKAIKAEPNSLGLLHCFPHIIVITKDFETSAGRKKVIASTADLYAWYSTLVKEVKNDPSVFKEQVTKLTASQKTPEDKIRAIYYWVQDNIKYIAFEDGIAGFKPEAAQNVYNNRYGDCKGMAILTREMLKVAGFDARLTWIGTNRIPYSYDIPSLAVDNHMICTVNVGDQQYILDPTEKYIALGKNGERIQGKQMLIENGENYILKKVPISKIDENLILQNESLTLEGEVLKGQGSITINGETKKNILYFSHHVKQEDKKKLFDKLVVAEHTNSDLVEITNTPSLDREHAMEVKYTFGLANKVAQFENDLYIDIDWNKKFKNLKIEEERATDYYFNWKINTKVTKKLKIPPGYKIAHIPANLSKVHPDFSFVVNFEQRSGELIYTNEIIVNHGLIKKEHFSTWNLYIKELNDIYNDQIVLTKQN